MPTVTNYNIENLTNSTGNPLTSFMQQTSAATGYIPGMLLLLSIYFVMFFVLKVKGASNIASFSISNFVIFVVALLFYSIGIISGYVLVVSIIMLPLSILLIFLTASMY